MKKKYIRPVTEVIVTRPGQILSGSGETPVPNTGMHHGNSKENVSFNDGDEDDGTDDTGWVKVGSVWDD
ncbi:MAG: transposase [Prevotella sp.]|nr:transposase [Prevotella sp.]